MRLEFPTDLYRLGLIHGMMLSFSISTVIGIVYSIVGRASRPPRTPSPLTQFPKDLDQFFNR